MSAETGEPLLAEFSGRLAGQTGLYFPKERYNDLERGISSAARQSGFTDAGTYLEQLPAETLTREQIGTLASHLTVGETYFFRDKICFDFLKEVVLPGLIRSRQETRHIRIWSAGCSSGEEPYSVAILLEQLLPDIDNWTISLLATDINPAMLARAQEGIYSAWAFRGVPEPVRKQNFSHIGKNSWKIHERVKRHVTFRFHNLVEDPPLSLINETSAMDLILCRNVLMYFSRESARKIILRFKKSLAEDGVLIFSPAETPQVEEPGLTPVQFNGLTFFKKSMETLRSQGPLTQFPVTVIPAGIHSACPLEASGDNGKDISVPAGVAERIHPPVPASSTDPARLIEEGRYAEAAALLEEKTGDELSRNRNIVLLARAYADHGDFNRALRWCERGIVSNRLNPALHYLHAIILGERGDDKAGREALRKTLCLDPDFILASIALGSAEQKSGRVEEAARYFENARSQLRNLREDVAVPESGGLTAGRLREILMHTGGAGS